MPCSRAAVICSLPRLAECQQQSSLFQSKRLFCLQGSRQGCITWGGLAPAPGRKGRGQRRGLCTSCCLPCQRWGCLQRGGQNFLCRFHLQIRCLHYSVPLAAPHSLVSASLWLTLQTSDCVSPTLTKAFLSSKLPVCLSSAICVGTEHIQCNSAPSQCLPWGAWVAFSAAGTPGSLRAVLTGVQHSTD